MKNNYLEIKVGINGTEYTLCGDSVVNQLVDINSIKIQDRADWSFSRGQFKFLHPTLSEPIAPYSLCSISTLETDDPDEVYPRDTEIFVVTSQVTRNFSANKYIHNCELMSLESLLECFILGTKAYTQNSLKQIMDRTCALLNQKYGITFTHNINSNLIVDMSFGTGTTLFDICKAVAEKMDYKFKVSVPSLTSYNLTIYFYNPASQVPLTINDSLRTLMGYYKSQDSNNYCMFLETEASNVVDRDSVVEWKDLTCRTTDVRLSADSALIMLPTSVESITKFEVKGTMDVVVTLNMPNVLTLNFISQFDDYYGDESGMSASATYQELIDTNTAYGGHDNIFQYLYDSLLHNVDGILSAVFPFYIPNGYIVADPSTHTFTNNNFSVDFSDKIVEKSDFDTIVDSQKSKFVFYESGTNVIQNLNNRYRDDFWGMITFQRQGNFLEEAVKTDRVDIDYNNFCKVEKTAADGYNPLSYSYNISAIPYTNPKIIDYKNASDENETNYKPFGRSYQMGNSNGLPIYFDALVDDMDRQNETLGRVEAVIDLDTTNYVIPVAGEVYPSNTLLMPIANQEVNLYGATYYISSLEHRFTVSKRYTQLNLSKTRYKISDAIGVDYQYNSVAIPVSNYVDRPIYVEAPNTTAISELYNYVDSGLQVFMRLITYQKDTNSYYIAGLAKRCSVIKDKQDNIYLYVEALDNYSFDKKREVSGTSIISADAPYGLTTAGQSGYKSYVGSIRIDIKVVNSLSKSDSELLPSDSAISGAALSYNIVSNFKVYKDRRERLTFTIKLKNPNN